MFYLWVEFIDFRLYIQNFYIKGNSLHECVFVISINNSNHAAINKQIFSYVFFTRKSWSCLQIIKPNFHFFSLNRRDIFQSTAKKHGKLIFIG